jgi:hypothetical protein
MPDIAIGPIYPSRDNAESILNLRNDDYQKSGIDSKLAFEMANSKSPNHLKRQIDALQRYPERYLGAVALKNGDLVGFSSIGEWTAKDRLPFSRGIIEKYILFMTVNFVGSRTMDEPFGIHELVVSGEVEERREIIKELIQQAVSVAESRKVYTAQCDDQALDVLWQKGFELTGNSANLHNGRRQLCVKSSYKSNVLSEIRKEVSRILDTRFMQGRG